MTTQTNGVLRRYLLIVALFQLLLSLVIPPMFSVATSVIRVSALSKYRELDVEGVIDHEKLAQLQGGRFAGDWAEVPDYLVKEKSYVLNAAYGISAACLVTSVSLFIVWWRSRESERGRN